MPAGKTIIQTIFAVQFTSGSFPHLGETPGCLVWCLPPYLSATSSQLTVSSHYRYNMMSKYKFFSTVSSQSGEAFLSLWGHLDIYPLLNQFHVTSITHLELSSLTSLKAWGDAEKFHSDIAFLLVSTEEGEAGDRVYGLSTIWVNPYQARISTVEEAVKQLTILVSSGPDWPYTLVWLNGDTCHVPLPREGHLSILQEGGTSSATCGRVSQLEVCQLLALGSQVIYPVRLNGCKVPVIASLPESLAKGTNLLRGEPIYLKVDILQSTVEGAELKVLPSGNCSSILMASPIKATPPKAEREVSMTMEVRELPSQVGPDMPRHAPENSTPKRLNPVVLLTPPPTKLGDFPGLVDKTSQVSTPDDAEMGDASLEEISTAPSSTAETPGPSGSTPPTDTGHL